MSDEIQIGDVFHLGVASYLVIAFRGQLPAALGRAWWLLSIKGDMGITWDTEKSLLNARHYRRAPRADGS